MSGNPFGGPETGKATNKSSDKRLSVGKKRNPFDDEEEATVTFQAPVPPPRPPKPVYQNVSLTGDSTKNSNPGAVRTATFRVFGGMTTTADSQSLFTRASSKVMSSIPSSSTFAGTNRYAIVTANSSPNRGVRSADNPFGADEDCVTEQKTEIETRSPLRISTNSSPSNSARSSGSSLGRLVDDESYRDSLEICNDTGIELMEAGRASSGPPKMPSKQAKQGKNSKNDATQDSGKPSEGKPAKPPKKKAKKIRKKITAVDKNDENAVVRHLLSELVYGYPHTYGGRCSNFRYYVQYNHPLLSIYFTHRLHPFSRRQRFIVFLCSLAFAVCFAFILLDTPLVPVFATCRSVCNCQVIADDDPQHPRSGNDDQPFSECVGGYNDGRACSKYNDICDNYESWMLSALCGAVTVLYDALLRFLATCSCVQGRKRFQNNCCGQRVKALVEYFGSVTLLVFAVLSFVFVLFTAVLAYVNDIASEVFLVLVLSELWSTVQWIVWSTPWFLYKFPSDKRKFYEKLRRRSLKHPELVPPEALPV